MVTPTENSKIISIDLDFLDTLSLNGKVHNTKMSFWTKDVGSAFLEFKTDTNLTDVEISIVLENLTDGSNIQRDITGVVSSPFYYQLGEEIANHGRWLAQITVKRGIETVTSGAFAFSINKSVGDNKPIRLISIDSVNNVVSQIEILKSSIQDYLDGLDVSEQERLELLTQYNNNYETLLNEINAKELLREQAEIDRAQTFNDLVESEMIAQNVATKLTEKESTFAPRMLSLESQLEQTATEIGSTNLRIDELLIPISPANSNIEVTDAHTSVVKGKTFTTLSNRMEESEGEFRALVSSELSSAHIMRSVPNGVSDLYDSSNAKIIKNVGFDVLSGNTTFDSFVSTSTSVYKMMITGWTTVKNAIQSNVTTFDAMNGDGSLEKIAFAIGGGGLVINTIALSGDALHLYLEKSKVDAMTGATLLEKCKAYLNLKPISIKYQLVAAVDVYLPENISANTDWILNATADLQLISSALIAENQTWEV